MSLRKTVVLRDGCAHAVRASMRPQRVAAENNRTLGGVLDARQRFHEAAACRCGKRVPRSAMSRSSPGFHEAAACRCGKRWRFVVDHGLHAPSFHEAAACRCGKRAVLPRVAAVLPPCFHEAAACRCGKPAHVPSERAVQPWASMRPQRVAAENRRSGRRFWGLRHASMRPQRVAAENGHPADRPAGTALASMRPQRVAAENGGCTRPSTSLRACFHEAAACRCGKHAQAGQTWRDPKRLP